MTGLDLTLLVLVLTLAVAAGARRLTTPMPVVLAAAGMALGLVWHLIPWLAPVSLPPNLVLPLFLPPLLTSAAHALPLGAFRRNLRPITLLAVGLVLATMLATAATAHAVVGLSWGAAFVLGAIVSPPDPVAATTVAGRVGLPHRLVVILEGEGLLNDAVAIVAYRLALDAAVGESFSWTTAGLALLREAPTGVAIGLALGWLVVLVRRRLDDVTLEAGISLVAPYVVYATADQLGTSAVLAVVTLGFVLQQQQLEVGSPAIRLATQTVWSAVRFASTALVFFLLGLLIGEIVTETRLSSRLLIGGAAVAATAILLRVGWMFLVPRLFRFLSGRHDYRVPRAGELGVLAWAGMRGVVSLALVLALPDLPGGGGETDARHTLVLITFAVIVATLLVQGTTLVPLVRYLGAGVGGREEDDERRLRARARRAGLAALARAVRRGEFSAADCRDVVVRLERGDIGIASSTAPHDTAEALAPLACALHAQRRVVRRMRDGGRIGETLAQKLASEIDIDETRVRGEAARFTGGEEL